MMRTLRVIGAVVLVLPLLAPPVIRASAAGAVVPPSPRATAAPNSPCGVVEFVPVGAPRVVEGTRYERIRVTASFRDGHRETAEFPYPWVYANGEQTDPWSDTNLRRPEFTVTLQQPPPGTDMQALPPLIRYVLEHTDSKGLTDLPECTPSGTSSHELPATPSSRELQADIAAEIAGKSTRTLRFSDATPADAPVAIVAATFDGGDYHTAKLTLTCVTFRNRSTKALAAIRFGLSYLDAAGRSFAAPPFDRFGSFAPGAVFHGIRGDDASPNRDVESMKNCRLNAGHDVITPDRITVTAVEFADGTTWPAGSPTAWPQRSGPFVAPADRAPGQVSGSLMPCGTYELGRAAPPRHEGNNTYETVSVTFTFADGHHEFAVFPYPWVYNDRTDRNPFAATNATAPDNVFPLRMPPKGTDTSAYPPALRFMLARMTSGGYGTLPNCPAYGSPTTWPDSAGIDFVDASAPDSPVEIMDPRDYALGCIAFRNRSDRTLSSVHFTLTQVDRAGHTKPPARIDRFGSFSPGVLIAGIPRGMSWGRTSNNMLRNCRWDFSWSPEYPVIRIAVTSAGFADGSTWMPSSGEPLHGSP